MSKKRNHSGGESSQNLPKQGWEAATLLRAALGSLSPSTRLQLTSLFLLGNFFLLRVFGRWLWSPEGKGEQFSTSNELVPGRVSSCCFQLGGWVGDRKAGGWLDGTKEARVIPCLCFPPGTLCWQSRASAWRRGGGGKMLWASPFCSGSPCTEVRVWQAAGLCQEPARQPESSSGGRG